MYKIRDQCSSWITKISKHFGSSSKVVALRKKLNDFQGRFNNEINKMQNSYDSLDLVAHDKLIAKYEAEWKLLLVECEEFYTPVGSGTCKTPCKNTEISCRNCRCWSSKWVAIWKKQVDMYYLLEREVNNYWRKGSQSELEAFQKRCFEMRQYMEETWSYIDNDGKDETKVEAYMNKCTSSYESFKGEWSKWVEVNNPAPVACKLACNLDKEIEDETNCKCHKITGWEKLTPIKNSCDGLRARITKMKCEESTRTTLYNNL
jgi:hypothetical protein